MYIFYEINLQFDHTFHLCVSFNCGSLNSRDEIKLKTLIPITAAAYNINLACSFSPF